MGDAGLALLHGALLIWVPAVWVYFDAVERGHSAYLWGLLALIPLVNVVTLVLYLIARSSRENPLSHAGGRARVLLMACTITLWAALPVVAAALLFPLVDLLIDDVRGCRLVTAWMP